MSKLVVAAFLALTACASYEVTPSGRTQKTTENYMLVLEKNSDKVRRYSGFYNTIDMEGTLLNQEVTRAQLEQSAYIYQWDDAQFKDEKNKRESKMAKETELFLSFYTPDRKNDTLFKADSIWKIFLDIDGRRYEGKAQKIKTELIHIEGLYPYHNRFYTPYSIVFPVPTAQIEGKPAKLTITGAVGSANLNFNSK